MSKSPIDAYMLRLQGFLDEALKAKTELKVLDAGCGSACPLRLPGKKAHVTGIDISEDELQRNPDLEKRIVGDIQHFEYQPSSFDAIICWNVLEHLQEPQLALSRFVAAIGQAGLIILGLPNVLSLKGILTKYTPHAVHVCANRYLLGKDRVGKGDVGRFRTYLRYNLTAKAIKRFAARNGLEVVYLDTYDVLDLPYYFRKGNRVVRLARAVYRAAKTLSRYATLGALGDSELVIVLQKAG